MLGLSCVGQPAVGERRTTAALPGGRAPDPQLGSHCRWLARGRGFPVRRGLLSSRPRWGEVGKGGLPLPVESSRNSCYTGSVDKRNVTVSLDEETARWARVEAARRDMSVSKLLAEVLREKMRGDEGYDAAMRAYLGRQPKRLRKRRSGYPTRDEVHQRGRLR